MSESEVVAETRRIANRGRAWAESRLKALHAEEWEELLEQLREKHPQDPSNARCMRAMRVLVARYPRKWVELKRMAVDLAKREARWQDGRRNNGPKVRPRPALKVVCPYCCADVDQRCTYPSGEPRRDHTARTNAVGRPQLLHSSVA